MTDPIVEAQDVSKRFDDGDLAVDVLHDISLCINSGETVAVLGASGSGKSTLLHILGGLELPSSGVVRVDGQPLSEMSDDERGLVRNQRLGFVYQFHHLLPEFSALENVAMPLLIGGIGVSECRERASAMLTSVGLQHRQEHRPSELSGGERQRAAIARALVTNPGCVLADEPTGNLDHENAERTLDAMMALRDSSHAALVIVTHDEGIAGKMQRVVTIHDGRLAG